MRDRALEVLDENDILANVRFADHPPGGGVTQNEIRAMLENAASTE